MDLVDIPESGYTRLKKQAMERRQKELNELEAQSGENSVDVRDLFRWAETCLEGTIVVQDRPALAGNEIEYGLTCSAERDGSRSGLT